MYTDDLFDKILIAPMYDLGVNHLCIVSGTASSTFSRYHIERLADLERTVTIELIIGMIPTKGLSIDEHENFKLLVKCNEFPNIKFKCRYVKSRIPVNSNVYVWLSNEQPTIGFMVSANYTFPAFLEGQEEAMCIFESNELIKVYRNLKGRLIKCTASKIGEKINLNESLRLTKEVSRLDKPLGQFLSVPLLEGEPDETSTSRENVQFGLYQQYGEAEFLLPKGLIGTDFFPDGSRQFALVADDGWENIMAIRDRNHRRTLEVATNKNLFTEYLKARLGLNRDDTITTEHLYYYKRSKIEFTKADGYYYLDFSPISRRRGTTGIHSIVEGQYYTSHADGGQAFNCSFGAFGGAVHSQIENPRSNVFEEFLSTRMTEKNIDNFKQSRHYQNVLKRYKQYPPPRKVKKLIFLGKLNPNDLN